MCSNSPEQIEAYSQATQEAISELTGCSGDSGCDVETLSMCGNTARRGLRSSSRRMQSSGYQLEFQIIQSFSCEYASCDSPSDLLTTDAIVASIVEPVETALSSDQFLTVLSANLVASGEFSAAVTTCIAVWGVVSVDIGAVSSNGQSVSLEDPGTGLFYPDWVERSGTCLEDGNQPPYMELAPDIYLFDSLEACCEEYYSGWNKNKCK